MRSWGAALAALLLAWLGSACAYRSVPESGLCRDRSIRSKPFDNSRVVASDLEGVAFERGSDSLWIGDDNANQIYVVDSETGRFRARLRERDFTAAFPDAKACDNGDPDIDCSYTAEFEGLTYDRPTRTLYVVNTVNKVKQDPAVDKPAIFRLQSPAKGENLQFKEWKEMPSGHKYGPIAKRKGNLYIAMGSDIFVYDYENNQLALDEEGKAQPVYSGSHGSIVGMQFQGPNLWTLGQDRVLTKVNWKTKEDIEEHDLTRIGLKTAKGLAFGRGEFFVVEGEHPNPIYVLRFAESPSFSRAGFLGGWPKSCPAPPPSS